MTTTVVKYKLIPGDAASPLFKMSKQQLLQVASGSGKQAKQARAELERRKQNRQAKRHAFAQAGLR